MSRPVRAAVFASGSGSNFQALLDAERGSSAPYEIVLLVSDRASAGAIERAGSHQVDSRVVSFRLREMDEVDAELVEALEEAEVEVIFLAGFLRLVPPGVVQRWRGRILNIHPALLPAFGGKGMWGMHVHRAVLDAGARLTGPTVHLVDEIYDRGAILAQWPVPVLQGDTPETLAARVLEVEHRLYPRVAAHLCRAIQRNEKVRPLDAGAEAFIPTDPPLT